MISIVDWWHGSLSVATIQKAFTLTQISVFQVVHINTHLGNSPLLPLFLSDFILFYLKFSMLNVLYQMRSLHLYWRHVISGPAPTVIGDRSDIYEPRLSTSLRYSK